MKKNYPIFIALLTIVFGTLLFSCSNNDDDNGPWHVKALYVTNPGLNIMYIDANGNDITSKAQHENMNLTSAIISGKMNDSTITIRSCFNPGAYIYITAECYFELDVPEDDGTGVVKACINIPELSTDSIELHYRYPELIVYTKPKPEDNGGYYKQPVFDKVLLNGSEIKLYNFDLDSVSNKNSSVLIIKANNYSPKQ